MGRIKGWEIEGIDNFMRVYKSIKKRLLVIKFHSNRPKIVSIDGEYSIKPFNTREEAFKYAMKYMREHPNG